MELTKELYTKIMEEEISDEDFKHVKSIIKEVEDTMEKHGYGLGECGYYFNENVKVLVKDGMEENKAKRLMSKAEGFIRELDDLKVI